MVCRRDCLLFRRSFLVFNVTGPVKRLNRFGFSPDVDHNVVGNDEEPGAKTVVILARLQMFERSHENRLGGIFGSFTVLQAAMTIAVDRIPVPLENRQKSRWIGEGLLDELSIGQLSDSHEIVWCRLCLKHAHMNAPGLLRIQYTEVDAGVAEL